jgi:hypothetical protein
MTSDLTETDTQILHRLRQPIDNLVNKYCVNQPIENRIRLRQLAWQAVDILVNTEDIAHIKSNKDIKRLLNDIRQVGGSEKFIQQSLDLGINIYNDMKLNYPGLFRRYKS